VAVVVAVLAAPATAAVASPPAVDQYTQHLPTAGGGSSPTGDEPPVAQPGLLPNKTQAALSRPDGQLLAQIATAPDLGAPAPTGSAEPGAAPGAGTGTSGKGRGLATVVADTAGTGSSLALIGALGGITFAGAWKRLSGGRRSSADL
jgi:hypothetical protein